MILIPAGSIKSTSSLFYFIQFLYHDMQRFFKWQHQWFSITTVKPGLYFSYVCSIAFTFRCEGTLFFLPIPAWLRFIAPGHVSFLSIVSVAPITIRKPPCSQLNGQLWQLDMKNSIQSCSCMSCREKCLFVFPGRKIAPAREQIHNGVLWSDYNNKIQQRNYRHSQNKGGETPVGQDTECWLTQGSTETLSSYYITALSGLSLTLHYDLAVIQSTGWLSCTRSECSHIWAHEITKLKGS